MTGDEIFNLAKKNVALPEESTLSEQLMFDISRNICKAFKDGLIDEQQARIEKNKAIQTFGTQQLSERIYKIYGERWNEVMNILSQARKGCGCEYCSKIERILDGREKASGAKQELDESQESISTAGR